MRSSLAAGDAALCCRKSLRNEEENDIPGHNDDFWSSSILFPCPSYQGNQVLDASLETICSLPWNRSSTGKEDLELEGDRGLAGEKQGPRTKAQELVQQLESGFWEILWIRVSQATLFLALVPWPGMHKSSVHFFILTSTLRSKWNQTRSFQASWKWIAWFWLLQPTCGSQSQKPHPCHTHTLFSSIDSCPE